jgi:hypothetical protein
MLLHGGMAYDGVAHACCTHTQSSSGKRAEDITGVCVFHLAFFHAHQIQRQTAVRAVRRVSAGTSSCSAMSSASGIASSDRAAVAAASSAADAEASSAASGTPHGADVDAEASVADAAPAASEAASAAEAAAAADGEAAAAEAEAAAAAAAAVAWVAAPVAARHVAPGQALVDAAAANPLAARRQELEERRRQLARERDALYEATRSEDRRRQRLSDRLRGLSQGGLVAMVGHAMATLTQRPLRRPRARLRRRRGPRRRLMPRERRPRQVHRRVVSGLRTRRQQRRFVSGMRAPAFLSRSLDTFVRDQCTNSYRRQFLRFGGGSVLHGSACVCACVSVYA